LAADEGLVLRGVTAGFHRMVTHRSFRAHPAARAVLLVCGSMAVEGAAITWAANHLKHHAFNIFPRNIFCLVAFPYPF